MYVLGVEHVMDMPFNDPDSPTPLTYGDVFRQTEQEYSRWNFDQADTEMLFQHFKDAEAECARILGAAETDGAGDWPGPDAPPLHSPVASAAAAETQPPAR